MFKRWVMPSSRRLMRGLSRKEVAMIIEPERKRPPRVFYGFLWKCKICDRIMICEKGVSRWDNWFIGMIHNRVCPDCDVRYADSPFKEREK